MATLFNPPRFVPVDGNGFVYPGAKLYFYATGTTTPVPTYSDVALTVTNANPVVADANGLFGGIYLDGSTTYKVVLKTSADVTVWTQDPLTTLTQASITAALSSSAVIAVLGYTPANTTGSGTTFLLSNVPLSVTASFFDGPNTGAIGGAGQKWLLMAVAAVNDTNGSASIEAAIHDGSNYIAGDSVTTISANANAVISFPVVVTLSAQTTFTLRAKDATNPTGVLLTTANVTATPNKATSITAVRLS